jgi:AP-3 complex subunit delta-1
VLRIASFRVIFWLRLILGSCLAHTRYDMSWIVFHVIESMSSHKQMEKRIGYMAAALCFHTETPVLMLCTNLVKKDLHSSNVSDGALALHTLAQIVTKDLARDLHQDVRALIFFDERLCSC